MSDDTERSVASAGSVGEPLAFAVMQPDSYVVVHTRHAAVVMRETCGGGDIIPLYRQPRVAENATTRLTDAEREAVRFCVTACLPETEKLGGVVAELCRMHATTLRGLLERLGGQT